MKTRLKVIIGIGIFLICGALLFIFIPKGGDNVSSKTSFDIKEIVSTAAEQTVYTKVYLEYGYHPTVKVTYARETSKNVYSVSGKVRVADKYGDQYVGTFDATVDYDTEDGKASVRSSSVSTLYKE